MDDVLRCHEALLQQRTGIRHHKTIHHWMKRCWLAATHADLDSMTQDEFEDMYSILLYEMTICWEEELNEVVLEKLWKRDAGGYTTLNLERFCCSIFFFVEMWVEEITMAAYEAVFSHVYRILSSLDPRWHKRMLSGGHSLSPQRQTFKPTLDSFRTALDNDKAMEELHMNFGKSISFNAQQYYHHFGTPTTHLQAVQATLLQAQSRIRIDPSADLLIRSNTQQRRAVSPSGTPYLETDANGGLARSESAARSEARSPIRRPMTSSRRTSYALDEDSLSQRPQSFIKSRSPSTRSDGTASHTSNEPFVLTGKSVLNM